MLINFINDDFTNNNLPTDNSQIKIHINILKISHRDANFGRSPYPI